MLIALLKHGIQIDIEHNTESGTKIGIGQSAKAEITDLRIGAPSSLRLSCRIHAELGGWQRWTLRALW